MPETEVKLTGPKGHWLLGNLPERKRDAVGFFARGFTEHGDMYKARFFHIHAVITARPDLAKEILHDRHAEFVRKFAFTQLSELLGRGLLTTEGSRWRKHRKLAQPAFHSKSMLSFFNAMVDSTEAMLKLWEAEAEKNSSTPVLRDLSDDMMKLTLRIVSESLFGFDTAQHAAAISEAVSEVLPQVFFRIQALPFANLIPNKRNRDFNRRLSELNHIISDIIEKRRAETEPRHDLLGMLMSAVDEDAAENSANAGLSNDDLRDEIMTMFMAGHETTANGLAWTLHLLADHPEVEAKLRAEIDRILGPGQERPRMEQIRELTYTRMVFEESLRLYPPVWAVPRTAVKDTTLQGVRVKKNSIVSVNIFLLHRNPKCFSNPLKFDPERFSPERRKEIDRYAYLPFNAGPHTCIGNQFALMEAQIILAMLYRRFTFERPADEPEIHMQGMITLRPDPSIHRFVRRR